MIDWKTIETEYVTTDISHRQLAEKYGICRSTISKKATDDKWSEKRNKHRDRTVSKAVSAVGTKQAERTAKLIGVSDLLLDKVKSLLEADEELLVDTSIMKDVSVILKNLKDIQMIRSEADLREQEARIEKLRKEAQKSEEGTRAIEVVFAAGPEEWNE